MTACALLVKSPLTGQLCQRTYCLKAKREKPLMHMTLTAEIPQGYIFSLQLNIAEAACIRRRRRSSF